MPRCGHPHSPASAGLNELSEPPTMGKFGQSSGTCSENGSRQLVNSCPARFLCSDEIVRVLRRLARQFFSDQSACLRRFRHAGLFGLAREGIRRNMEGYPCGSWLSSHSALSKGSIRGEYAAGQVPRATGSTHRRAQAHPRTRRPASGAPRARRSYQTGYQPALGRRDWIWLSSSSDSQAAMSRSRSAEMDPASIRDRSSA